MRSELRPGRALALVGVTLALASCARKNARSARPSQQRGPTAQMVPAAPAASPAGQPKLLFNDGHVHLTNYIQEGLTARDLLAVMGDQVGRAALFGIPLQQQWSFAISGEAAPDYYLESDAPLYYYSFTDADIAREYLSLSPAQRQRFDPMITGFNPADMYAVDHIRRVLESFPGVFVGIGEFTIHKEFVSAKIAGGPPSLSNPALDRILRFAGEAGLLVLLHNDIDVPFAPAGAEPVYLRRLRDLFRRHPKATIIWAHVGLGRVIHPVTDHVLLVQEFIDDPGLSHVYFDISWIELAKYVVSSPRAVQRTAWLINNNPKRFLFGTDEVAPESQRDYLEIYRTYAPLWKQLTPEASYALRIGNYERLFDKAEREVRAWERANLEDDAAGVRRGVSSRDGIPR